MTEQDAFEREQVGTYSSEETSSSDDESMAQLEDGPKPGSTGEERQTEDEPPGKRTRMEDYED